MRRVALQPPCNEYQGAALTTGSKTQHLSSFGVPSTPRASQQVAVEEATRSLGGRAADGVADVGVAAVVLRCVFCCLHECCCWWGWSFPSASHSRPLRRPRWVPSGRETMVAPAAAASCPAPATGRPPAWMGAASGATSSGIVWEVGLLEREGFWNWSGRARSAARATAVSRCAAATAASRPARASAASRAWMVLAVPSVLGASARPPHTCMHTQLLGCGKQAKDVRAHTKPHYYLAVPAHGRPAPGQASDGVVAARDTAIGQ